MHVRFQTGIGDVTMFVINVVFVGGGSALPRIASLHPELLYVRFLAIVHPIHHQFGPNDDCYGNKVKERPESGLP